MRWSIILVVIYSFSLSAQIHVDNAQIKELLSNLSIDEKISLLGNKSPGVDRLNIPAYNWWNEALHGVARSGKATIFPQAIGMAASFNPELMHQVASSISTEARAKYNIARSKGQYDMYQGITFWSPNINIFRDPRWGRGQETYGEDPFLTGEMGVAFVKGLQGDSSGFLKTSAGAKHFAVHSGPEAERHGFNAVVNQKDLRETYLYAFKKVVDAGVESIMCAYNRMNDEPCCTSESLLQEILRNEWGFGGHVVTDCGALYDIFNSHKVLPTAVEVAAEAIKMGINMDCSNLLQLHTKTALGRGLLTEAHIDSALFPALRTQFRLGMFSDSTPFDKYGQDNIASKNNVLLSRRMSEESMVLLMNKNNILPLNKEKYGSYMLLGPNAASLDAMVGNYHGVSSRTVTFVDGLTDYIGTSARIEYDMGCNYTDTSRFGGIWAAGNADISIVFLGLTPVYEGEHGDAFLSEHGADRLSMDIPKSHIAFLKELRSKTKTPIILVLTGGSAVNIESLDPYADAILMSWYPGQEGGNALANILFGDVSPSGRLPITFYRSLNDLPEYKSYAMDGRTYRYFDGEVQFPFGFGLSYSQFEYSWIRKPSVAGEHVRFIVRVNNIGEFDCREVVQAYIHYPRMEGMPLKELKAFQKVNVHSFDSVVLSFEIPLNEFKKWDEHNGRWHLFPGTYKIVVGSHSRDQKLLGIIEF